ncbi:MAG TPA: hypothetical protein GXZ23_00845 [Clostridiales bacterium]|nr:hypothetical protein [Clostridiales bacterium]
MSKVKNTKILSLISILLVCVFVFCSCENIIRPGTDNGNTPIVLPEKTISLPYSQSDSLNPYRLTTQLNYDLMPLLYEALYEVDNEFNAKAKLASESKFDHTKLTVSFTPTDFSDGSPLSVYDIVYSFEKAKASSIYENALSSFKSAKPVGKTVVFTLSAPNRNALSLLTFPIIKKDTGNTKDAPIGTGKYKYNAKTNTLDFNPINNAVIKEVAYISLYDISDITKLKFNLDMGNISAFTYNLSSYRLSGLLTNTLKSVSNNLIFLGFNQNNYLAGMFKVRQAAAKAINRSDIASSVYGNNAVSTFAPFHPYWFECNNLSLPADSTTNDYTVAENLLIEAGFDEINQAGVRSGEPGILNLSLIVCTDNEYKLSVADAIKADLNKIGIGVIVHSFDKETYKNALLEGNFDMYIGEIKLPNDCSLDAFFTSSGTANYGINIHSTAVESYKKFKNNEITISEFVSEFIYETPFIPLCYRSNIRAVSTNISVGEIAPDNLYADIENWTIKE